MLKHIREILKDVVEHLDKLEREHERIYSELDTIDKSNDKEDSNAQNSTQDYTYPEHSHYNPYYSSKKDA